MTEHDPSAYGRHIADLYDATVRDFPTELTVARLAELADGGAVLELGIGTGRLALPLAASGLRVAGIDGSPEMVAVLRAKPGGDRIPVVLGDFSEASAEGSFALVVLVYNTIFALPSQAAQVRCFANAARHLAPGGRFVIEAWVPDPAAFTDGTAVRVLSAGADEVLLEAATLHPADQTMRTTKIHLTERGGVRLLPANHRYAWPAELDLMAELAGLQLQQRWSDWDRTPWTDASRSHVSVYRTIDD
jgi:SAM-dependent methyltransferase